MLTGKYQPGKAYPAGSRATDAKGGADMIARCMNDDVLAGCRSSRRSPTRPDCPWPSSRSPGSLQNSNVSAAIIGASRPEQVSENVKAAGVKLEPALLKRIDDVLGDAVERDPAKTMRG